MSPVLGDVEVMGAASSLRFGLPSRFTRAGGRLYFPADDGTHGEERWALPLSEAGCPLKHDVRLRGGR